MISGSICLVVGDAFGDIAVLSPAKFLLMVKLNVQLLVGTNHSYHHHSSG